MSKKKNKKIISSAVPSEDRGSKDGSNDSLHEGRSFRIKEKGIWNTYLKNFRFWSGKDKENKGGLIGEGV